MSVGVITEGDKILEADITRQLFNVDGTGTKVGIISTSFNAENKLDDDVTSGELPGKNNPDGSTTPVQILKDLGQDSPFADDEGRALAQIVHDIAPGAELSFHTFIGDEGKDPLDTNDSSYAEAVNSLVESGVDIIVDDAQFATSIFQDGEAAQAIDKAVAEGVVYVPAAGNNGNISYESEFRPGETFSIEDITFKAHDFDPGNNVDLFQDIQISKEDTTINPLLSWDEPIDNATSAYEMFLLSSPELPNENNIVGVSTIPNEAALDDSLREFSYVSQEDEELYLLIAKQTDSNSSSSPNQIKWISRANGSDRTTDYEYIDEDAVNNTVFGPANAEDAITVGATDIDNPLEPREYSSQGGAPILFDTEGNRLNEPITREKPNVFAVDGVSTAFDTETPFNPFNGTSAAAPHVAGIIALMMERAGGADNLSPETIRSILQQTALPVESEQTDAGLIQADEAAIGSFESQYIGTEYSDFFVGNSDAENFYGKYGDDVFEGLGGNDYLLGEQGNDTLLGGRGNDVLVGGEGYNILEGGTEKDTFILDTHGVAVISDFEIDHDTLAIAGIGSTSELTFSPTDNNSTLIERGENTLAFISNVTIDSNFEILHI
ncbi:MAG: S8 family serine peptidase [Cyanobacteria bacterium P01_A01_bin.83]